jgi:hypothetical protein
MNGIRRIRGRRVRCSGSSSAGDDVGLVPQTSDRTDLFAIRVISGNWRTANLGSIKHQGYTF